MGPKRVVGLRKIEGEQHRRQDRQPYQTVTVTQRRRRKAWHSAKRMGMKRVQQQKRSDKRWDRREKCFS